MLPKISFSNFSAKIYLTLKRLDYGQRNMASDEINWFNPANTWDESGYEMIGVLFGLAVYNSVLLDVRFPLGECETPEVSFSSLHFADRSSVQFYFLAVYRKIVSVHTQKLLRRVQYLHAHNSFIHPLISLLFTAWPPSWA
jgi:hypothetical protein